MKTRVFLGLLLLASSAHALPESTRGPFYGQSALGFAAFDGGTIWFRPDLEFGWHPSGRSDGFALGLRQVLFTTAPEVMGATLLRLGYDIAIPIKDGKFEVTVAPFGVFGAGYGMGTGAFNFSIGVEGRFYFWQGMYGFFRPFSLGGMVRDGGYWVFDGGLGVGYSF
jgi:hypothetical protein